MPAPSSRFPAPSPSYQPPRRAARPGRVAALVAATAVTVAGTVWGVGAAWGEHRDAVRRDAADVPPRAQHVDPAGDPRAPRVVRADRPQRQAPRVHVDPLPPVLLAPGDTGDEVRELQARLRQIAWFEGDVTDFYGDVTRAAVAGFQTKRGLPSTGSLDAMTLERLEAMTTEPTADELANRLPGTGETDPADGAPLDPRCTTGRVLCVDKTSSSLRWVVDGEVRLTLDARFGGNGYTTREGSFQVERMSRDHVSSLYDTSMPFAMFFSGGQAVHYSPDFAAVGYAGASHGCVNLRDYDAVAALFEEVRLGDRVVVSWS